MTTVDYAALLADAIGERDRLKARLPELDRIIAGLRIVCGQTPQGKPGRAGTLRECLARLCAEGREFTLAEAVRETAALGFTDKGHVCSALTELIDQGHLTRIRQGHYRPHVPAIERPAADANGHAEPERAEVVA